MHAEPVLGIAGYAALFAVGVVAAIVNVIAAGGSFLTLPLLIFLGFPAAVANGTNRVGVLAQNLSAAFGFHQREVLPLRWSLSVSVPAVAGAGLGVWGALHVSDVTFRHTLSVLMLGVTVASLLHRRGLRQHRTELRSPWHPLIAAGSFLTGIYGGFIQAGVGFLMLAVTTAAGLDLVRGNAVKVFTILLLTLLSLVIFAGTGHVHWRAGLALGAGNVLGGAVGVRIAVLKGHVWLERALVATTIVFAILLWIDA